jgi:hypothetical protein
MKREEYKCNCVECGKEIYGQTQCFECSRKAAIRIAKRELIDEIVKFPSSVIRDAIYWFKWERQWHYKWHNFRDYLIPCLRKYNRFPRLSFLWRNTTLFVKILFKEIGSKFRIIKTITKRIYNLKTNKLWNYKH